MKKISRMKGNIELRSVSLPNGIGIGANKLLYFGSIGSFSAETKVYGDEVITRKVDDIMADEKFEMGIMSIARNFRLISIPFVILSVILLKSTFYSPAELLSRLLLIISVSGVVAPISITRFILKTVKKGEYLSESQFRGAIYQVINAFYDLGRVPKFEELNDYSIFSRYDPYFRNELNGPIIATAVGLIVNPNLLIYASLLVLILLLLHILFKTQRIYAIEFLVVSKPTEKQKEAAIKTLEEAISFIDGIEVTEGVAHEIPIEFIKNFVNEEKCYKCPKAEICFLYQMIKNMTEN